MARVFITGSADGLGLLAARSLLSQGHEVIAHARNDRRAGELRGTLPEVGEILIGDLSSIDQTRSLADQVNRLGRCQAVIHNAGVFVDSEPSRTETEDGVSTMFAVNTLAPYLLTALIERPDRLVYLSSGMHVGAGSDLSDFAWRRRRWNSAAAYSESKLYVVMLAFAVARHWPGVFSNAVDPGWVPTRMGGPSAPDDLQEGYRTQAWLAVSDDNAARTSGRYFYHRAEAAPDPTVRDANRQDRLLGLCRDLTEVALPPDQARR